MKRIITGILAAMMLISCLTTPIFAEDTALNTYAVQPRLSNVYMYSTNFGISDDGIAEMYFEYEGKPDTFAYVTIEIYLEKRTLGLFWSRVDNGLEDNKWRFVRSATHGYIIETFQLKSTGTYRATYDITFSGNGTADDVMQEVHTQTY